MDLCKGETEGLGPGTGALGLEPLAHCKVKRMAWDLELQLWSLRPLFRGRVSNELFVSHLARANC